MFEKLLGYFDIVIISSHTLVWVIKVEEKFISTVIKNPDDSAVFHYSNNSSVLKNCLNGLVIVSCKMPEVLYFHFFEDSIWTTGHEDCFRNFFLFST